MIRVPIVRGAVFAALVLAAMGRAESVSLPKLGPTLEKKQLIEEVLARNPTLGAAQQAVRAAQARVPQVSALDDPQLSYSFAPGSIFVSSASYGQVIQLSQSLPFPGKRGLAGDEARAEAQSATADVEQARLELSLTAIRLYDEWFVVHRALELNAEHQDLIRAFKRSATAQYVSGSASQQDPLQAEVELAHLQHQAVVLGAQRDVVRVRLDALLHVPTGTMLPPPPKTLDLSEEAFTQGSDLKEAALRNRPELAAMRARLGGAQAAIALAKKQYWPDFRVTAQYNSMWAMPAHQWMVGVGINLPIFLGKRRAAEDEALAKANRLKLEEEKLLDDVGEQVDVARTQLEEARHVVHLYETRLVPAAEDEISAARASFVVGKTAFNTLVQAEKNLRDVQLASIRAAADLDLRRAELQRAIGQLPGLPPQPISGASR